MMKSFFKYIAYLVVFIVFQLYLLDYIYTTIYVNATPRDKVSWMKSMKTQDNFDYIVLGSSRSIHHINPIQVSELSNKNGLNLGYAASGSFEIKLMLKAFFKNNSAKKVFVQVDENFNNIKPKKLAQVTWMPFIKEKDIYEEFIKHDKIYWKYKYLPFYRYQKFEPKIGVRNVSLSLINKTPNFIENKGFVPIFGEIKIDKPISLKIIRKSNINFKEIIKFCNSKNIEITFFTSPIYNQKNNFNLLSNYLPNYYDLSNSVKNKKYFKDQTHLNALGAEEFTKIFTQYFLTEKP